MRINLSIIAHNLLHFLTIEKWKIVSHIYSYIYFVSFENFLYFPIGSHKVPTIFSYIFCFLFVSGWGGATCHASQAPIPLLPACRMLCDGIETVSRVINRRVAEGLPRCPLYCFVHGTALKVKGKA